MAITRTVSYRLQRSGRIFLGNPLLPLGEGSKDVLTVVSTDEVNRGPRLSRYRELIRSGGNATTALSGSRTFSYVGTPGNLLATRTAKNPSFAWNNQKQVISGQLLWLSSAHLGGFTLDASVSASNRSLTNLYSNLSSVETSFKGAVFTGELRETLRMIRHPALSLRKGVGDYLGTLHKRVPRKAPRRLKRKIVADTWLEYAYGWGPAINDLDSAIKAFYRSKWVHPVFEMVRGHGQESITAVGPDLSDSMGGFNLAWFVGSTNKEIKSVKHYGVYTSKGKGQRDSHSYGFSPTEFIPTLWELLPYSFLVDYFTNVGDILSSWSYRFIGLDWCARTTYQELTCESSGTRKLLAWPPDPDTYVDTIEGDPGYALASRSKFVRDPVVSLSVPSLELEVPGMKSVKWVNIAALATSLLSARKHINP